MGSGLLALGVNNALPIAAPLTMGSTGSNGAFDMASFSQQLGGLAVGSGATAANQVIGNSVASSISTLTFSSSSSSTFGGTIQDGAPGTPGVGGQVALTVAGGLLNLSGSNTYSGLTTVSGGTLQLGSASALYAGAAVNNAVVNGTLDLAGYNAAICGLSGTGTVTNSGGVTNSGSATLTVGLDNATNTFAGAIADGSGAIALVKSGSGTQTLTGVNAYSGGTTLNGGVLTASSSQQIPPGTITVNPGATMNFAPTSEANRNLSGSNFIISGSGSNGNGAIQVNVATTTAFADVQIGNVTLAGNATIGAFGATYNNGQNAGIHFSENMSGTSINLSGYTLTFVGDAKTTSYLDNTNIISGTGNIVVASGNLGVWDSQSWTNGTITLNSGATIGEANGVTLAAPLVLNGGTLTSGGGTFTLTGSASLLGNVALNNSFLALGGTGVALQGNISGSGGFTNVGGTNNLSGANTYTGPTTVAAGTLQAGSATIGGATPTSGAFGVNSPVTVQGGAKLDLNGYSETIGSLSDGGTTPGGTITSSAAGTPVLTVGGLGTSTTFSGVIQNGSATVGLAEVGSGALTLAGANTYSGGTTVSGGTLQLGTGVSGQDGSIGGASGVTNNSALVYNLAGNQTVAYPISGSGSLTKTGAGTLMLTASQT